jgi:hypothetical protein
VKKETGKLSKISLVMFLILCLVFSQPTKCKAAIVWQDDFNDGDYDGWEADSDILSVDNNYLQLIPPDLGHIRTLIHHNSSVANGTWTFDVYLSGDSANNVGISFIHVSTSYISETLFGQFYRGYQLKIDQTMMLLNVYNQDGATSIGIYRPLGGLSGWQNINITRDLEGLFVVYVNGTRAFETVDTQITASEYFIVEYTGYSDPDVTYFALDNIMVSNTVDIIPPESLAGHGMIIFIVVIAVAIIIWWVRREGDR